jgi:hypothetical protein
VRAALDTAELLEAHLVDREQHVRRLRRAERTPASVRTNAINSSIPSLKPHALLLHRDGALSPADSPRAAARPIPYRVLRGGDGRTTRTLGA